MQSESLNLSDRTTIDDLLVMSVMLRSMKAFALLSTVLVLGLSAFGQIQSLPLAPNFCSNFPTGAARSCGSFT